MKKLLALLLCVAMCLPLFACGGEKTTTSDPAGDAAQTEQTGDDAASYERVTEEGTLTVGYGIDVDGFDPVDSRNIIGMQLVYETLFYRDPDTNEIKNLLADSYEFVDDTHIRITLREDARFSNGEPVTAEDVLWSWERIVTNGSSKADNTKWIDFENTEIVSDREFIVAMTYPFGSAVDWMSMVMWSSVLDKSAMENADAETYWSDPVGSGPYRVVENVDGSGTTYALRDDYWNAELMPDKGASTIYMRNYSDSTTMMIDFEKKELDVVLGVDTTSVQPVMNGDLGDVKYEIYPDNDVVYMALPEYVEAFDDINVRKAMAMALDVELLTEIAWGDLGEAATSFIPSTVEYYHDCGVNVYDPEQAKQLLTEAGYGPENPLELTLVNKTGDVWQRVLTMAESMMREVGVNLNIVQADNATVISYIIAGDADFILMLGGGCASGSPYEFLQVTMDFTGNPATRITDETYNSYAYAAREAQDPEEAAELYAKCQEWITENYRAIPIAELKTMVAWQPYITSVHTQGSDDSLSVRFVEF